MVDEDGNRYLDYAGCCGALILGHTPAPVREALRKQIAKGIGFGAPTELEVQFAERICAAVPSVEKVRLVNSGTEAAMSVIRLARAFTGCTKIVKFDGCYHGDADSLLVKPGTGIAALGVPDSPGVPPQDSALAISVPFNDGDRLQRVLESNRSQIAAVIVEPVAAGMGVVPPARGFLQRVRKLTREHGALLIFDEVRTGFRLAYGGAQELFGIRADITCLGNIIGGGLPIGAFGGRKEIMKWVAPEGPVHQASALSGNPLAVAAGIATLISLKKPGTYRKLERLSSELAEGLSKAALDAGAPVRVNRAGSMFTVFFTSNVVKDYESARTSDTARYGRFFHAMLERGIYLAPSQFDPCFVSLAHTQNDIQQTIRAAREAFNIG